MGIYRQGKTTTSKANNKLKITRHQIICNKHHTSVFKTCAIMLLYMDLYHRLNTTTIIKSMTCTDSSIAVLAAFF